MRVGRSDAEAFDVLWAFLGVRFMGCRYLIRWPYAPTGFVMIKDISP